MNTFASPRQCRSLLCWFGFRDLHTRCLVTTQNFQIWRETRSTRKRWLKIGCFLTNKTALTGVLSPAAKSFCIARACENILRNLADFVLFHWSWKLHPDIPCSDQVFEKQRGEAYKIMPEWMRLVFCGCLDLDCLQSIGHLCRKCSRSAFSSVHRSIQMMCLPHFCLPLTILKSGPNHCSVSQTFTDFPKDRLSDTPARTKPVETSVRCRHGSSYMFCKGTPATNLCMQQQLSSAY